MIINLQIYRSTESADSVCAGSDPTNQLSSWFARASLFRNSASLPPPPHLSPLTPDTYTICPVCSHFSMCGWFHSWRMFSWESLSAFFFILPPYEVVFALCVQRLRKCWKWPFESLFVIIYVSIHVKSLFYFLTALNMMFNLLDTQGF